MFMLTAISLMKLCKNLKAKILLKEKLKTLFQSLNESETTDDVINSLKNLFNTDVKVFVFDSQINSFRTFSKYWTISEVFDAGIEDVFDGKPVISLNRLYYPLMKKNRLVGIIESEKSSNEILELLDIASGSISLKIQNIELSLKMQKNIEFHDAMKNIAKIIESQYELNYIIPIIGEILDTFISNHLTYIFLKQDGEFKLKWPTSCNDTRVLQNLEKLTTETGTVLSTDKMTGCFPLINENSIIGAIVTKSTSEPLIPVEIDYLEQLASQTSTTINRANVYAEILKHATLDALTGFYNRRQMEERIKQETASAKRKKTPLCAIMIDIDYFKHVNDTYGHAAGDFILKTTSKIIRSQLREYDIASRYGGEEFAIILPYTTKDEAVMVAERLRKAVADKIINIEQVNKKNDTKTISITISQGIYSFNPEDSAQDLLMNADKALYDAKESGRNKVVVYEK